MVRHQKKNMPKKARGRRRTLQPGIQKHKIISKTEDGEGIFGLIEKCISEEYLQNFFKFAEKCFVFHTKINCKLCLAPYSLSQDGKLEHCSRKRIWIHYFVLLLLAVSMIHKFLIVVPRISSGTIDTTTFICIATFLCYLVAFSVSSSFLILTDETIDLIHCWPRILMYCAEENEEPVALVANTKTAVVVSSVAILAQTIAWGVSVFSFVFPDLPATYIVMAGKVGLVPVASKIPRIMWKLLLWPLELMTYILPLFMAAWAPMILMIDIMVARNCVNQLRYVQPVS